MKLLEKYKNNYKLLKMLLLVNKGMLDGKITPFNSEFYEQMSHTYVNCIPVSMHIKYLKPILPPGKCFDRSLFMFFCFDDALLVRGDTKDLGIRFGKDSAMHGWIELGDYVYDPSSLMRFDKNLYYKIYEPKIVDKFTKDQYNKVNNGLYDQIRETKLSDFQVGGSKRFDLVTSILPLQRIAECSNDVQFQKDLNDWLDLIGYDEEQILKGSCASFKRTLISDGFNSVVD